MFTTQRTLYFYVMLRRISLKRVPEWKQSIFRVFSICHKIIRMSWQNIKLWFLLQENMFQAVFKHITWKSRWTPLIFKIDYREFTTDLLQKIEHLKNGQKWHFLRKDLISKSILRASNVLRALKFFFWPTNTIKSPQKNFGIDWTKTFENRWGVEPPLDFPGKPRGGGSRLEAS